MRYQTLIVIILAAAFSVLVFQPAPAGMTTAAWHTALMALLMAALWMTVALPLAATALLPLLLLPSLGVQEFKAVAPAYADPVLWLFMAAMFMGAVLEQQHLPRRLVLLVTRCVGCLPAHLIAGMMLVTFFISMWISNTATVAIILPLALALVRVIEKDPAISLAAQQNFARAMILGVAYASILGGSATLIGTPPNALFAAMMQKTHGIVISFTDWMMFALPMALLLLLGAWLLLCRVFFPQQAQVGNALACSALLDKTAMPAVSTHEKLAGGIFLLTILLWITQGYFKDYLPWLSDSTIALAGAVLMFVMRLGDEKTLRSIAWDVLILLGGGLALAGAITSSGLGEWLASQLHGLSTINLLLIIFIVVVGTILLSELASNTAIVAAFVPVSAAVAGSLSASPVLLAVPLTLAASYAFMLPAGTPSSAMAYSTGYLTMPVMLHTGIVMNAMAAVFITLFTWFLAEQVLL